MPHDEDRPLCAAVLRALLRADPDEPGSMERELRSEHKLLPEFIQMLCEAIPPELEPPWNPARRKVPLIHQD